MGLVYPSSEGFLMIRIQNVCGKAILMCLIPILVEVLYDGIICPKTPFKGLSTHDRSERGADSYYPPLPKYA